MAGVQRGGKLNASAKRDRWDPYEIPTIALSTSPSLPFARRPRRLRELQIMDAAKYGWMPQNIPSKRSGPGCFDKEGEKSGNRFTVGSSKG